MDNMKNSEEYKEKSPKGNGKRKSDIEFGNMKKKVKSFQATPVTGWEPGQTSSKWKATGNILEAPPEVIPKCVSENDSTREIKS